MIERRYCFTLTKHQVEDLKKTLLVDIDTISSGIEQPNGTYQFDLGYEDLEDLIENLAAACNHAEDEKVEARLETIYEKLTKVLD